MIEEYVHSLDRALRGPRRLKADLLTEVRHSLVDAAAGHRAEGLPAAEADRVAVAEFGQVRQLAGDYQVELAAASARTLTVRVVVMWALLFFCADLTWRGAPWTGTPLPSGYPLLSASLSWLWLGSGLVAVTGYLWLTWSARRGPGRSVREVRVLGRGLAGSLVLGGLAQVGIFTWSLTIWDSARTWPPMILGLVAMAAGQAWLGDAVRSCLTASRPA